MQAHFGCSRSHKWVLGSPHQPQHHHPAPHHPQHHHFQSSSSLIIYNALSSHWPVVKTLLHSKLPFIRCTIHLQPSETKISEPNWPTLFWRFSVEFNNFQSQQMILDAWRAADGVLQFQSAKSNFKKKNVLQNLCLLRPGKIATTSPTVSIWMGWVPEFVINTFVCNAVNWKFIAPSSATRMSVTFCKKRTFLRRWHMQHQFIYALDVD